MEIKELVVYEKEYPERKAVFSEFPQDMLPELKGYLENAGIPRLYCHQAEMFERAQKKENLVITTSTASGKTLGFLLPVLQEILKNPLARQFYLSNQGAGGGSIQGHPAGGGLFRGGPGLCGSL